MDENFNNQQNNQQNNQYNQQNDQYNQQYNQQQYNQPQYNQQQYNQPQYNQQQYNQPNNYNNYNNYAPLVLGIVSFFCCGSVCSIVGIVLGVLSRKKKPTDNGMATAGIVLSIIALAIWAIYFIYVLVVYGSFSAVYNASRYY